MTASFDDRALSRREFLKASAMAGAVPWIAGAPCEALPWLPVAAQQRKTERVVLVAFAGGVRSKEVLGTPTNVPNLMRIASAGVTLPNVHCENFGHYGATLSIFTGSPEAMAIRTTEHGLHPTLFEYLRRDAGFAASEVWLSTSGGAQGRLYAHSDNPAYGAQWAANMVDGDGLFNADYKKSLDALGHLHADSPTDQAVLEQLGRALDKSQLRGLQHAPDPEQLRQMERFILDELQGQDAMVTGPGAADAKAIRVALKLLKVFRPRVLGITLQAHDIAHSSYNGYVEVIRRNDQELGALWNAIQQDPELARTTAILVLPEFGRDKDINQRNGLDHGDYSDDMKKVFLIAAGPDFQKNKVLSKEVSTLDVCPTVLSLLAPKLGERTKAKAIKELLA